MTDSSRKSPDPKGIVPMHASETGGSRLAHWPPPTLSHELKPLAIKHGTNQPIRHATRRGWRMTRSMFAEFQDGEDYKGAGKRAWQTIADAESVADHGSAPANARAKA